MHQLRVQQQYRVDQSGWVIEALRPWADATAADPLGADRCELSGEARLPSRSGTHLCRCFGELLIKLLEVV